ncbi:MAG: ribosome maturation factor RimM [Lachnospiraceae bacterium]
MEDFLRVGVITTTHGIAGEVKVFPTTDDAARFKKLKTVIVDMGREKIELNIASVKFFKNLVILKFKEFNNINDVEKFVKKDLLITRDNAVPLGENENFICDLIGLSVITDDGIELGKLTDVLQTGANDVYVVTGNNGREILIPAIRQCILNVDIESKCMTVHLLEGLIEI